MANKAKQFTLISMGIITYRSRKHSVVILAHIPTLNRYVVYVKGSYTEGTLEASMYVNLSTARSKYKSLCKEYKG